MNTNTLSIAPQLDALLFEQQDSATLTTSVKEAVTTATTATTITTTTTATAASAAAATSGPSHPSPKPAASISITTAAAKKPTTASQNAALHTLVSINDFTLPVEWKSTDEASKKLREVFTAINEASAKNRTLHAGHAAALKQAMLEKFEEVKGGFFFGD